MLAGCLTLYETWHEGAFYSLKIIKDRITHLHSGQLIGKPAGGSPLLTGRRAAGTPLLIGRWERKPLIGRQSGRRIPPSGHWSKEYKELVLNKWDNVTIFLTWYYSVRCV